MGKERREGVVNAFSPLIEFLALLLCSIANCGIRYYFLSSPFVIFYVIREFSINFYFLLVAMTFSPQDPMESSVDTYIDKINLALSSLKYKYEVEIFNVLFQI